jgi:hypothetical protein
MDRAVKIIVLLKVKGLGGKGLEKVLEHLLTTIEEVHLQYSAKNGYHACTNLLKA